VREIEFRGKVIGDFKELGIKNGDWIYGDLVRRGKEFWIVGEVVEANEEYIGLEQWIPVIPESVGQYTGLNSDITYHGQGAGVKIYEGDIFDYKGQMVIVEYIDDMFHLKSTKYPNLSNGNYRLATLHNRFKVIGNVTDNPEFLGGSK